MTATVRPVAPLRVIIVEHDLADAELCLHHLRLGGLDVHADIVATPDEFSTRLQGGPCDIILADYRLPGWTGVDALGFLRDHGYDIPLILVTGTLGEERAVESVKLGAADYVLKTSLGRLPHVVRRALEEKAARAERGRRENLILQLKLALDQSPASTIITNTNGVIEYVNHRFTQVTGYSAEEAVGRTPRLLSSGVTPRETYEDLWRTIRSGNVWRGEVQNRNKRGELYWDSICIAPVRDASGNVTHFVGTQEDISERRRADQRLRASEAMARLLLQSTAEGIYGLDLRGRCTFCNPAAARMFGYDRPEALLGRSMHRLVHHTRRDGTRHAPGDCRIYAAVRLGVPVHADDEVFWRADGSSFAVEYWCHPIREGGTAVAAVVAFLDITERRSAQEALEESEARFRKLTEASFDGIAVVESGVVREANRGFADMFGYSLEEVIGRAAIDFVADESREMVGRRFTDRVEGAYEMIGRRKDGSEIAVEVTARTHDVGGKPGRVAALRDVTAKRLLEAQLRQAQKMEAVGRLAGGVAHDFNNLLTVITSYTDLLLEGVTAGDRTRDDLREIRKAADAAAGLTRQLLAFSRQQVIQPRPVSLDDVVANVGKILRRLIGEDVELVTVPSPENTIVRIDPGQLEQVILNLAVNARDAMPMGGRITIATGTIDLDETEARAVAAPGPGRFGVLSVADTGIGMDERTKDHLFEPFFTTKDPGKGTGLGLATVYGIVEQSGGFIGVQSEAGNGSTFTIHLPLATGDAEVQRAGATGAVPHGSETVLVAEDDAAVRAATCQILRRYGYTVLEAPSGDVALGLAAERRQPIHLLLTDVVMPGMGGRDLAEQVAARRPGISILFMSGYTDDAVLRHGVLDPGIPYLQKPFSPETLARKVREVLDAAHTA